MKKNQNSLPILNIVIPCYNEEEVLPITRKELDKKIDKLIKDKLVSKDSRIVLVNDGSIDNTWNIIEKMHNEDKKYIGIKLSRNRGHQNALLAGLMYAKDCCDISVSMDSDLQDDINVIDKMIKEYNKGNDIVYGVRSSRKKDCFFKRATAEFFYKLMRALGVEVIYNHADCRLMSRRALEGLAEYKEVNLFLRGIVPLVGFNHSIVYYERDKRAAGSSKYPFKKMLSFALDGITSFSIKPLTLITNLGLFITLISIIVLIYCLVVKIIGNTVSGWTFLACSIWLIGGIQMLCLGVIGEYIGKIYQETKARPRYIIEKIID